MSGASRGQLRAAVGRVRFAGARPTLPIATHKHQQQTEESAEDTSGNQPPCIAFHLSYSSLSGELHSPSPPNLTFCQCCKHRSQRSSTGLTQTLHQGLGELRWMKQSNPRRLSYLIPPSFLTHSSVWYCLV